MDSTFYENMFSFANLTTKFTQIVEIIDNLTWNWSQNYQKSLIEIHHYLVHYCSNQWIIISLDNYQSGTIDIENQIITELIMYFICDYNHYCSYFKLLTILMVFLFLIISLSLSIKSCTKIFNYKVNNH